MRARPELVGGEGSLDTLLMSQKPGWVAKGGAEGLLCGIAPDGTGFAVKSEDGNSRPLRPALAQFLGVELGPVLVESSRGDVAGVVGLDPEDAAAYEVRLARGRVDGPAERLTSRSRSRSTTRPGRPSTSARRRAYGPRSATGSSGRACGLDVRAGPPGQADHRHRARGRRHRGRGRLRPRPRGRRLRARIREPDWCEHRLFSGPDTNVNLHVFSAAARRPTGCSCFATGCAGTTTTGSATRRQARAGEPRLDVRAAVRGREDNDRREIMSRAEAQREGREA